MKKSPKSRLRSAYNSGGAPKGEEGCKEYGIQYRSNNTDQSALVEIVELPSQTEERGNSGIECRMKQKRGYLGLRAPTGIQEHLF
jgi:hypothetical protein